MRNNKKLTRRQRRPDMGAFAATLIVVGCVGLGMFTYYGFNSREFALYGVALMLFAFSYVLFK